MNLFNTFSLWEKIYWGLVEVVALILLGIRIYQAKQRNDEVDELNGNWWLRIGGGFVLYNLAWLVIWIIAKWMIGEPSTPTA